MSIVRASNEFDGDLRGAYKRYLIGALKGNVLDQANLGYCFHKGLGVEQNEKAAFFWYHQAAEKGDSIAQYNVGFCYETGFGIEKDTIQAIEWYGRAAEQGDTNAAKNLGRFFCYEPDIAQDMIQSVKWYRKAAEQGDPEAKLNLGIFLRRGIGAEKDEKQAFELFTAAAAEGYASADHMLGLCFENGNGVEKDEKQAMISYEKAVERGCLSAKPRVEGNVSSTPKSILKKLLESKDHCIPAVPSVVDQTGQYCGSAAFAQGVNCSKQLSFPIYASVFEYDSRKTSASLEEKEKKLIVLEQLKKLEAPYASDGPQFSIHSFDALKRKFGVLGEAVIMPSSCTEEECRKTLTDVFKEGYVAVLACDSNYDYMLGKERGKGAHYVLAYGYGGNYIGVTHNGVYALWSFHDWYESNKQIPDENPYIPGGNLKEFRSSFFKIWIKSSDQIGVERKESAVLKVM